MYQEGIISYYVPGISLVPRSYSQVLFSAFQQRESIKSGKLGMTGSAKLERRKLKLAWEWEIPG